MTSTSVGPFPGRIFRGAQRLMLSLCEAPSRIGREDGGRAKRVTDQQSARCEHRYLHCSALAVACLGPRFSMLRMKELCLMILKVSLISKRKCPDTVIAQQSTYCPLLENKSSYSCLSLRKTHCVCNALDLVFCSKWIHSLKLSYPWKNTLFLLGIISMNIKKPARHEKFSFPSTDNYFFCRLSEIINYNLIFYKWTDRGPERWGSFLSVTQQHSSVGLFPTSRHGKMQVLGNQCFVCVCLIAKRVIFK